MFEALNAKTNEVFLAEKAIQTLPNWKKEKWVCPHCKEEVAIKKEHTRIDSRCPDIIIVTSHFSHHPDSTCKRISETDSHYSRKMFILSQLYSKRVPLSTGTATILVEPNEIIGAEKGIGNRRADILISFKNFDPIFGKGVAFEIMESESYSSIEEKMISWASEGYSLTYFTPYEFEGHQLRKEIITVKYPMIKLVEKTLELLEEKIREKLHTLRKLDTIVGLEEKERRKYNCSNCKHSSEDTLSNDKNFLCCWLKRRKGEQIYPDKRMKTSLCDEYQPKIQQVDK